MTKRKEKVLRVNVNATLARIQPGKKKPTPHLTGGFVLMPRLPNTALPNTTSFMHGPVYQPGHGEQRQVVRHGAEDFLRLTSFGNLT